jgi:hypothetical protein
VPPHDAVAQVGHSWRAKYPREFERRRAWFSIGRSRYRTVPGTRRSTDRRCCAPTVTTTLTDYTHLFADDHADAMSALGALETPKPKADNVVPM